MDAQLQLSQRERFYSMQLTEPNPPNTRLELHILPWDHDGEPKNRLYSKKQVRSNFINPHKERKQSVDERIQQMYRKYSRDGIGSGDCFEAKSENSRQAYRKKLDWLQKAEEFKQLGSKKNQLDLLGKFPEEDLKLLKLKNFSNFYYLDQQILTSSQQKQKVAAPEYKCTRNFQRMLKIKDKIRKKNVQSISKDKQKYQQLQQNSHAPTHRDTLASEISAKATLERNKLKIKMRGISNKKICALGDVSACMEVRGTCSNGLEYSTQREHLNLTHYAGWNSNRANRDPQGLTRIGF